MRLPQGLKNECRPRVPLRELTTFRIGGPAEAFAVISGEEELRRILAYCRGQAIRVRVIGAGSNILAADDGVRGMVIKLSSSYFNRITITGNRVVAGAGASLPALIRKCAAAGLSGVEFLAGIPGTVGGATAMNCGVGGEGSRRSIGDLVEHVKVMGYNGTLSLVDKRGAGFGYRGSAVSSGVIIAVSLCLKKSTPGKVASRLREWILARRGQEYRYPSAGCVFKNPPGGLAAGKLIDDCGLKGARAGGAVVSEKHANFIVNTGAARFSDVRKLMRLVQRRVKLRYGIGLEPEIRIWK